MLWDILIWIVVGAVAGILADLVVKRIKLKLIGKIIVGILGGLLGGWVWNYFTGEGLGFLGQVIAAFAGAVVLLLILRVLRKK